MATITLKCGLEVIHPLPQGECLFVQFYWSRDVAPSDAPIHNARAGPDFTVDIKRVTDDPHLPRTLNLRLYSLADHDNSGANTELLVGNGSLPTLALAKTVKVDLENSSGDLQARLTLTWSNPNLTLLQKIPAEYHDATEQQLTQQLIGLCRSKYQRGSFKYNKERQVFYSVSADNGFLPIVCFPLLATLTPPGPLASENVSFLVHSAWIACRMRGQDAQAMSKLPTAELLEVINETLTLVSKCLLYTSDRTRSAKAKPLFNEQWERLSLFPHRSLAGYDCEDIAQQIQEVAHAFRSAELPPLLEPIGALLKRMTVFTVEGDLDVDGRGSMTPHCYVLIVDADYIDYLLGRDKKRRSSYIPSLVVEGTNWYEGTTEASSVCPETKVLKRLFAGRDVVKVAGRFNASGYGLVAQMQTADHRDGEMLTLALVRDLVMGVQLGEWMNHSIEPQDVQLWTRTPKSDRRKVEAELLEMPLSYLPRWDKINEARPPPPSGERAVMRWKDWTMNVEEWNDLLPEDAEVRRIDVTKDGCAFALITLPPSSPPLAL